MVASRLNELARCDQLTNTMKAMFPPAAPAGSTAHTSPKSHRFQALVEKENVSMVKGDEGHQECNSTSSWWVRTSAHVLDQAEAPTELLCANLVLCEQGQYERCEALRTLGSKPIGNTLLFGASLIGGEPRAFLAPPGVEYAFVDPTTSTIPHTPAWYAHIFAVAQSSSSTPSSLAESLMRECDGSNMVSQKNALLCRRARYELNPAVSPLSSTTDDKSGRGVSVVVVELILGAALS